MIKVDFSSGYDSVNAPAVTQWDKGRTLEIYGLTLQATEQVHFANKSSEAAIIHVAHRQSDGSHTVTVPNSLLESSLDIYAYIYVATGENGGKTVKTIKIPVNARVKPEDFISEPDKTATEVIQELVNLINAGAVKGDKGDPGQDGQDYTLKGSDLTEIAGMVIEELPWYDGTAL